MICFDFENAAVKESGFREINIFVQEILKQTWEIAFPHEICSLKKQDFGRVIALG